MSQTVPFEHSFALAILQSKIPFLPQTSKDTFQPLESMHTVQILADFLLQTSRGVEMDGCSKAVSRFGLAKSQPLLAPYVFTNDKWQFPHS